MSSLDAHARTKRQYSTNHSLDDYVDLNDVRIERKIQDPKDEPWVRVRL